MSTVLPLMGVRRSSVIRWTKSYGLALVLFAAGVLFLGIGVGLGIAFIHRQPHFGVDIARAALTLGSGLILGGAVKAALDHYRNRRPAWSKTASRAVNSSRIFATSTSVLSVRGR
jgi:hypothetical protein